MHNETSVLHFSLLTPYMLLGRKTTTNTKANLSIYLTPAKAAVLRRRVMAKDDERLRETARDSERQREMRETPRGSEILRETA